MSNGLSRRGFAKMAGMAALGARAGLLRAQLPWAVESPGQSNRFAFAGVMGDTPGIYVYATYGESWKLRQIGRGV
jgi:hypothetical protein